MIYKSRPSLFWDFAIEWDVWFDVNHPVTYPSQNTLSLYRSIRYHSRNLRYNKDSPKSITQNSHDTWCCSILCCLPAAIDKYSTVYQSHRFQLIYTHDRLAFRMFARGIFLRSIAPLTAGGIVSLSNSSAKCSGEDHIPSLDYGWSHHGALASFDYASIRRGFQVYRQVCASCHSIDKISFRTLVGVTHDEAKMKALAESYEIEDG